eukprot:TRINITY_DN66019_c0_g1_i1.p2 TRINITY_DN66019_c0_g1~~TRINITY_DN66019_c0_g1_i1.p2  ORF type:complete len:111 (+),score=16.80 TRINITY_DN66019_c0_g1_i1:264-596(+)
MQESKNDRAHRLARSGDLELWRLLLFVKQQLMASPQQTLPGTDLGRGLPEAQRSWLKAQDLRLCRILDCYPQDFAIHGQGGVVDVQCLHDGWGTSFTYCRASWPRRMRRV